MKRDNEQRYEGSYDSLDMLCGDQMDWKMERCWHAEKEGGGGENDQGEDGWMRYMK